MLILCRAEENIKRIDGTSEGWNLKEGNPEQKVLVILRTTTSYCHEVSKEKSVEIIFYGAFATSREDIDRKLKGTDEGE